MKIFSTTIMEYTTAIMTIKYYFTRICSRKLRRALLSFLFVSIVLIMTVPPPRDNVPESYYERLTGYQPMSAYDIWSATNLPKKQISRGIMSYPKMKCNKRCLQKTVVLVKNITIIMAVKYYSTRVCSRKLRRALLLFLSFLLVSVVFMMNLRLPKAPRIDPYYAKYTGYHPVSVFDIRKATNLHKKQISKEILSYPEMKCNERCLQKTVVLVVSKASNKMNRDSIRQTWGSPRMQLEYNFCLFFLLGKEESVTLNEEISTNNDIVHVNVTENYYTITEKVMECFNWVTHFCHKARHFFKIDDDVYLDLEFLKALERDKLYLSHNVLFGDCKQYTPPTRVQSKYYVSEQEYPLSMYPPYCGGPGYFMTLNTAIKIYDEMLYTKPFKLEDAYIGMVIFRLGIPVNNIDHFIYGLDKHDEYMQSFKIRCSRITHGLTAINIQELWSERSSVGIDVNDCSPSGKKDYTQRYFRSFIFGSDPQLKLTLEH